jgi:hypothetical protein
MLIATLLAAQLAAVEPAYVEAKARADEYEALLLTKDRTALVDAQTRALETALQVCGPAPSRGAPITVVVRIGRDGLPESTWRNGESEFGVCVERELGAARLPVATGKAFYTSYELSFAP